MINHLLKDFNNLPEYELERFAKALAFNNERFYLRENYYGSKENDMDNTVFAVFDIFDENLNGNLQENLVGIYNSISEAASQIEKKNLDNFRWVGSNRCKFSKNGRAHMIIIERFTMNELFV